ncbi:MAG: XRE family transcriptional regulator [Candidatus Omnitrophota bacterium]
MNIGEKIKQLRKTKKMTLAELSQASGVALATISRVENAVMTGTLESHMAIAKALGITLPQLYSEVEQQPNTVDASSEKSRSDIFIHSDKSSYEMLTTPILTKKMMPTLLKIESLGKTTIEQAKAGTEKFLFVISGKIEVTIADKKHILDDKDTLYFDASLPHFYRNIGKAQAKMICVTTPPML